MTHLQPSPARAARRTGSFLLLALTLMTLQFFVAAPRAQAANDFVVSSVTFNSLADLNNLTGVVKGTLTGHPFETPFMGTLTPGGLCAVLSLELAPIHIQLLGLHVDTSAICLTINADERGGLLGQLLCSLAGGITLTPIQVSSLQSELASILNRTIDIGLANPGHGQGGSVCTGRCVILHLQLGPVHLELLGLIVDLNNCTRNGPVEICVSATAGEGLLGNLLCGLTSTQLLNLSLADITRLVSTALGFLADGRLSPTEAASLTLLVRQLVLR